MFDEEPFSEILNLRFEFSEEGTSVEMSPKRDDWYDVPSK